MIEGRVSTSRFVWFLNINAQAHHIQKSVCLTKGVVAEINLLGALCQDTSWNTNAHERVGENLEHLWWPAHPGKAPWACGDVSENSWQVTNATSTVLKLNAQDPQTNERLGSGRVSSNCWQTNAKKAHVDFVKLKHVVLFLLSLHCSKHFVPVGASSNSVLLKLWVKSIGRKWIWLFRALWEVLNSKSPLLAL